MDPSPLLADSRFQRLERAPESMDLDPALLFGCNPVMLLQVLIAGFGHYMLAGDHTAEPVAENGEQPGLRPDPPVLTGAAPQGVHDGLLNHIVG